MILVLEVAAGIVLGIFVLGAITEGINRFLNGD